MARIISFSNQKGGVGKTTSAINLAAYVTLQGKTVLIIDLDPQGNSTSGLGIDKRKLEVSIHDLLMGDASIDEVINSTCVKNLHIMPSNVDLAAADLDLISMPNREFILKNAIAPIIDIYDYIFIDCPPSLGLLTVNALAACNSILIPIQSEFFALEGVSQLMNTVKLIKLKVNPNIEINGVALTMYDSRSTASKQVKEELSRYFGKKLYPIHIPRNIKLSEAPSHGIPISMYAPNSTGAYAYEALAQQFIEREGK